MILTPNLIKGFCKNTRKEVRVLTYCTNCGTKNEDEAKFCIGCGVRLDETVGLGREIEETCLGPRDKRYFEDCFGLPHGGTIVGLVIGILIVMWGLVWALRQVLFVPIWQFTIIVFGILIVVGAVYGIRKGKE